jgi:hypothetical protein
MEKRGAETVFGGGNGGCTEEGRQVAMEAKLGGLTCAHVGPPRGHSWYSGRRIKDSNKDINRFR